jgi:hypothetical protein
VSILAGFLLFSGASNEWLSIFQAFAGGAILMMFANSMIIMWLNLSLCAWILCFGLHSGFGKCGIKVVQLIILKIYVLELFLISPIHFSQKNLKICKAKYEKIISFTTNNDCQRKNLEGSLKFGAFLDYNNIS